MRIWRVCRSVRTVKNGECMSNMIITTFNPEWEDQELDIYPECIISVGGEDEFINALSRRIDFEWQHPQPKRELTPRERFLALCKDLGLKPREGMV